MGSASGLAAAEVDGIGTRAGSPGRSKRASFCEVAGWRRARLECVSLQSTREVVLAGSIKLPRTLGFPRVVVMRSISVLSVLVLLFFVTACDGRTVVEPPEEDGHVFSYVPPAGAPGINSISVRGGFNNWGETATPMQRQADGSWRAVVELDPSTHEYKFFINGEWVGNMCHDTTWGHAGRDFWVDPDADGCVPDGHGGQNAVVSLGAAPGLSFSHSAASPAHVSGAGGLLSIRFEARAGQVQGASVTVNGDTFPMHFQLRLGMREVWRAAVPEGTASYGIRVRTPSGTESFGPYAPPANLFRAVPWVGEAVGYQIFPERFWNGDPANDHYTLSTDQWHALHPNQQRTYPQPTFTEGWGGPVTNWHCCHQYFGGDLKGILDRMDHLQALGVTMIYLNPIFLAGSAHGYDAWNFFEVAPNFGDKALLRQLLDAAEARGMRLMWDFVPNHVGVGFWAFQHAIEHGHDSPYWNWFNFRVAPGQVEAGHGGHYDGWWGFGSLPVLRTTNAAVFEHLMEVTRYWTEFGFHGIRVDVPNEIRNRAEFFSAFRRAAKGIDPDVYLVAEIWQRDASWLQGDQFDALMNYAIGEGVVERFALGHMNAGTAEQEMARLYAEYPEASTAMQFNLISSHDTARLLTKMGGGALGATPGATAIVRQQLASAMLYALPGMPVTFQGDECAFLGRGEGPREENRYPMQWQACDAQMLAHYHQLAELKRSLDALSSPVIRAHRGAGSVLSFYRGAPGPGEVLVVFNNAQAVQSFVLPSGSWTDAASGQSLSGNIQVGALGWRYLRRN
jgi:cyclomaltodextrinase / maltogenic alpha-amylase / neopullulanase